MVKSNFLISILIMCFCLTSVFLQASIDPSIVLYITFEEQTGKVDEDLSQFGHKAEFRKKTAWSAAGKHGGCIELGIGNWLEVKDHDSLDLTNKMTIMFWSKLMTATGDVQSGIEKEPAWQVGEYNLLPEYTGGILLQANDLPEECDDEAIGGPVTIDKKWHHCVGTFDGKEIKIYGDGKLRKELPCKGAVEKGNGNLYIGCRGGSGRWIDGFLDEIKMYNRVLTKEEIIADMEDPMHNLSVSPIDKVATTWGLLKGASF
ncbi:MAG: LamG domain-containing protein [Candidatus Poribacteria bacterium]|nr:LamG domain-containing protein [Candidatus Poribacteria bacterium]